MNDLNTHAKTCHPELAEGPISLAVSKMQKAGSRNRVTNNVVRITQNKIVRFCRDQLTLAVIPDLIRDPVIIVAGDTTNPQLSHSSLSLRAHPSESKTALGSTT